MALRSFSSCRPSMKLIGMTAWSIRFSTARSLLFLISPIIDHRSMHSNPLLFNSSIHPSHLYYRIVADELRRRGFIE